MIAWIRSYLAESKKLVALILLLGVTAVVFAVGLMFVAGYLISASADNAYSILMLNIPLAFVQIFGLGKPIARYCERLFSHDWVLRLTSHLRHRLFLHVQANVRHDARWKTGEVLATLASDIEAVQNIYLRAVFPILIAWLGGVILVCVAGVFSLPLMFFALGMLVLLCGIVPALSALLARARIAHIDEARTQLYDAVTDRVLGAQDVAISGRGDEVVARFESSFDQLRAAQRRMDRSDRIRLVLIQVLLLVSFTIVLWWVTARFGGVAGASANWIVATALGFFPLVDLFAPLSQQFEDALSYREALLRMSERGLLVDPDRERADSLALEAPLDLVVSDLHHRYGEGREVLAGISLSIPYGQKVALLGKSGSGKTTLARLLHGDLVQQSGSIELSGIAVQRLRDVIWDHIGFISQDSYVFAMSIADNLRIGKIDMTDEEAWDVLELVGLKNQVASLPDGLETLADEAGLNFSGGQRQRLALARVFLQDPAIVILDEPTVGLDPITEEAVLEALLRLFSDKTVVMITHHLQGVEAFDRVVFLEEGAVLMDGSPVDLERESERYRKLLAFDKGLFS